MNKTDTQLALIISHARSGTNYLQSILRNYENFATAGEVFAPNNLVSSVWSQAILKEKYQLDGKDLIKVVRENPIDTIAALIEGRPQNKKTVVIKLFNGHITHDQFEEVVRRFDPICIFLDRVPIDAYISFCKALKTGKWIAADVTATKPKIRIKHFFRWRDRIENDLRTKASICEEHGANRLRLRYEVDLTRRRHDPTKRIVEKLEQAGVPAGKRVLYKTHQKQDKNWFYARRIKNPVGFTLDCIRHGDPLLIKKRFNYSLH
ncbi:MAG: hypothetical protein AAGJ34_01460 [Pseudomonadota bacterium]